MTAADLILDILAAHGVRDVFGMPGDAINDFTDALRRRDDMRFVLVRHEEAGAFMASAQAKLTGQPTACMGTSGPGAVHLLNGLYDAKLDHAPVIAITGQAPTQFVGTSYHQEVDLERLFSDVAEYSQTVMTPKQLPDVMLQACKAALSAPGVAHISVPTDVAGQKVTTSRDDFSIGSRNGETTPCPDSLRRAVELIIEGENVAILAGIGASGARKELLQLAEQLDAPVIRTLRAKDFIDDQDEACVGGLGLLGGPPASEAMDKCDTLLIVGADYPYVPFYPKKAKVIQVEASAVRMGKRVGVDGPLHGHAQPTLAALLAALDGHSKDGFLTSLQDSKAAWQKKRQDQERSDKTPIRPQRLVADIAAEAPDDAIFLSDTGTTTAWTARHLPVGPGQRYTLSSGLGSMAFAMSGAIGAQLAYPDRRAIAITGDGGFAMLMADFVTAVRHELPIVCVVLNNSKLGFIALEQQGKGLPEHSIDLTNPDFVKFAESCGGLGIAVDKPEEIRPALREALASDRPSIIDVKVNPEELIMPPKITLEQAASFGLAKIREFLS
jgi:thiamine pyrophosphate-dependent acetolactate synthase large subunit-like protein